MRGSREEQKAMFSYVTLERRIPKDHPLRGIRALVDAALERMDGPFDALYAKTGRPSIAPERLLRALLLQVLYSLPSERRLVAPALMMVGWVFATDLLQIQTMIPYAALMCS